jgi:gamma-glutamyltranspeptidase/glutathione hydrolase
MISKLCKLLILVLAISVPGTGCRRPEPSTARIDRGVVSAPEVQAGEVGAEILRSGGNAVDAAIAVQFAISVTNAIGAGIGGGGFMVIYDPSAGDEALVALDYREVAPAAAHRDMFLDEEGNVLSDLSMFSVLAAGVPGTVRGMAAAHEKYGSLPWSRLLEPAIRLAEEGFVVDNWTAGTFDKYDLKFGEIPEPFLSQIEFKDYYNGTTGAVLRLPDLATTLRRIAVEGPDEFYGGRTAELIIDEMQRAAGLISVEDLAGYRVQWRPPIEATYRGYRIVSMPPPSSGGVSIIEFLNMLETFDVPPMHSADQIHLFAEIAKRVFADRAEHLGDPAFHDTPVEELTGKDYARSRSATINRDARSDPETIRAGEFDGAPAGGTETTHFSIVDRNGMAVANTTTLNTGYGSGIVVDGAGFLLNSQMNDFSAKPGVPNVYGVTGSAANEIAPGKRPLSSMSPTLVFDPDGRLILVLGSPGGSTIVSSVIQVIVHTIDYGLSVEEAVDQPRFHHQWPPIASLGDRLTVETQAGYALPDEVVEQLAQLGYTIDPVESIGDIQAIAIVGDSATGVFDRRRTGGVSYE